MSAPNMPAYQAYPQAPMYATPGVPQRPHRPGTVITAFVLYLLWAIGMVLIGALLLGAGVWADAVLDAQRDDSGIAVGTVKAVLIVFMAVYVIAAAVMLLFVFKMRAGRNWARIVLTVFTGLYILGGISASGSFTINDHTYRSSGGETASWIGVALAVLAIVMMYVGPSNTFFRESKAARRYRAI